MASNKTIVTITSIPTKFESYFMWFIYGFYELERQGKIKFRLPFALSINNRYIQGLRRRICASDNTTYCLIGNIQKDGKVRQFCIDCADNPSNINSELLAEVDVYFKMQCLKEYDSRGFILNSHITLKYLSVNEGDSFKECCNLQEYKHKIKPLMVGPRRLGDNLSYQALKSGYENYHSDYLREATQKVMCYFGNAKGPRTTNPKHINEYDEAGSLVFFGDKINHPNEKRKIARDILLSLGKKYDARLINESNSDTGGEVSHPELVVPLKDFCRHISNFQYNLNISGYRLSIPNRFIESFMVGTAIVTDRLSVMWYKPFGQEVVETVTMGYEPTEDVNWNQFKADLCNLPDIDKKQIIKEFEAKWEPSVVSQYIIETLI